MMPDNIEILRRLGKGKSGVSYLASYKNKKVIYKEMHDEPVPYYRFEKPKIELEIAAYHTLKKQKIPIPRLISYTKDYLIKEYIEGKTLTEQLVEKKLYDELFFMALSWEKTLKKNNMNIDYFPGNFVMNNHILYYIDYELNPYTEQWNFRNWGIYYWLNGEGFKKFLATNDAGYINENDQGIPLKNNRINAERTRILKEWEKQEFILPF
jgi:TP53 regulating kinase-like protein